MKGDTNLKNRDFYLNKLIAFQDTEPVKIITGIRRCGKSSLMKLMIRHLKETGISKDQIVEMNFESHDFQSMTAQSERSAAWRLTLLHRMRKRSVTFR